jgi:hypothetical protein
MIYSATPRTTVTLCRNRSLKKPNLRQSDIRDKHQKKLQNPNSKINTLDFRPNLSHFFFQLCKSYLKIKKKT